MPIVDYNRIYRVRSQERKPITNPVTGPDAAGAFLRGAVPAALAPMHGLNARIDAIRGETNAMNRRDALRLDGIASGIRAAGDAYQAYIRAMERRDAAELDKLEAAYTSYMVSGSDAAFSKPRKTEDGKVTDGPGAAIRQLDKDFEETDAYKAANRRVKDAFSPRREARRAVYFAKGDRAQFEAARTEHAQAVKDRAESDDVAVSKNLDPYNYRAWKEMTEIAIESDQHRLRLETGKFDVDADGREIQRKPLTQEELRKLEDKRIEKRDAYILQRAAYYGNLIAQDDGTLALTPHLEAVLEAIANNTGLSGGGQVEDDGMPDSDIAFANETVTDPLIRMQIGGILANARQQRERNVEAMRARDNARANDLDEKVGMGSATQDEIAERASLLEKMSPEARRHHEERENHTRSFLEFARWEDANPMEAQSDEKIEDAFARRKKAKDEALALPTPEARDMALRSIDRVFGPAERAYLDDVDAALYQMSLTGFWGGEMLSAYDQREKLRECAEKGLLQRGKASQYGAMIEAQEKDPEKRAARADAIRAALARYVRPAVLDNLLAIDPNRGVVLSKTYDPSGEWAPGLRTTGYWKNRSNEVVRMIAESVVKFDRLRATGAIKADKTLDQFLEETVGKSDAYLDSRDDEIIGNISAAMLSLDAEETAENVRRSGGFRSLPIMDLR